MSTSRHSDHHVFKSKRISTQENTDASYTEIGVIHVTETAGINAIRSIGDQFANVFGAKGFANTVYDEARHGALVKLRSLLGDDQKVCNVRLEVQHSTPEMIAVSAYGTLLHKSSSRTRKSSY